MRASRSRIAVRPSSGSGSRTGSPSDTATVSAGYAPNVLPGVVLAPAAFSRVFADVQFYPSRWAFADYLALDVAQAHVAVYSVAKGPLPPVKIGFAHLAAPAPCSGSAFRLIHEFQTWIKRGATWKSPLVRIRVGATAQQSILDYRARQRHRRLSVAAERSSARASQRSRRRR